MGPRHTPTTSNLTTHGALAYVLMARYPMLARAVGDDEFTAIATAYRARHDGRDSTGAALPGFLAASLRYPLWYAELATLERTRCEVLAARTSRRMSRASLVDAAHLDDVWLRLVTAHAVLPMSTRADELWRAMDRRVALPEEPDRQSPRTVLVWRHDLVLSMRQAERDELPAFRLASRGASFVELARLFDGPPRALDVLLRWIDDGLLEA